MAVEIIRTVWCDVHLKGYKKKVDGVEGVATALHDGQTVSIDLCAECESALTWAQILEYGTAVDQPKLDRSRLSEKIKDRPSPGKGSGSYERALVECSICGKQLSRGAGFALHNKVHERDDGKSANPIPVAL